MTGETGRDFAALVRHESQKVAVSEAYWKGYNEGEAHGVEALAARVLAAFERPPVWGPNENGDLMLDMSLDGFLSDLRAALSEHTP